MRKSHLVIPEPVTGYHLEEGAGWFSVLKPVAAVNLFENPSAELTADGFTGISATSTTRVATQQRRGVYAVQSLTTAVAGAGVYRQKSLTAGVYAFGVDFKGPAGRRFTLSVQRNAASEIAGTRSITATGRWQRITLICHPEASAAYNFRVTQDQALVQTFWTDGWQLEATPYATSYFDGDSIGFLAGQTAYYWSGLPHASTSVRIYDTGAGGREMNLFDVGFRILAVAGLSLAQFAGIATPLSTGGAYYQQSIIQPRQFALVGTLDFATLPDLDRARAKLIEYLNPQRLPTQQPLVLRYHRTDPCTGEETETLDIPCVYESGLEGSLDNLYQQRVPIVFRQHMPVIHADGEQGVELGYQDIITEFTGLYYRDVDGTWKITNDENGAIAGAMYGLKIGPDGLLYAIGFIGYIPGASPASYIARWNGLTWSALGDGINELAWALAIGPDGTLYAGGQFTAAGGGAAARVAKWDGASWSALGAGLNATVWALAIGPDGALYAGGEFTTAGGGAASRIAKWDGASWSALGAGMNGPVYSLAFGPDGALYAGGQFTTAGGGAASGIARWDGTAWSALGAGVQGPLPIVYSMAFGPDGMLYAGGIFTTAGTVTSHNVARWNGAAWSALGDGLSFQVRYLELGPDGLVYISGQPGSPGDPGATGFPNNAVVWTGSSFMPIELAVDDAAAVYRGMVFDRAGRFFIGGSWDPDATVSVAVVSSVNAGSAPAYPVVRFTGPGRTWMIKNYTTQDAIYFDDLVLLAGEVLTVNCDPINFSVVSTFRGNLANKIMPGSSATLRIVPGQNNVSAYMGATSAASAISMRWSPAYHGLDGATP